MNRALASTLSAVNGLVALFIVLFGGVIGYGLTGQTPAGVVIGAFVGFLVAAITCGLIAYLTLIERHLAQIAGQGSAKTLRTSATAGQRVEPTL